MRAPQAAAEGAARDFPAWLPVGKKGPRKSCSLKGTGQPDPHLPVQAGTGPEPCRGVAKHGRTGHGRPEARPASEF